MMSNSAERRPIIGITMGDPAGIGPEIVIKALSSEGLFNLCRPVVFGDKLILEREIKQLKSPVKIKVVESLKHPAPPSGTISMFGISQLNPATTGHGRATIETGKASAAYIIRAAEAAAERKIDAVVTAPINKKSLQDAGYVYPGHTEMLADLTGTPGAVMMLAGQKLRVVLVSVHCALSRVSKAITPSNILNTILVSHRSLKKYFSVPAPRIAVAALNPHAGEEGLFGWEEKKIITPAIQQARIQEVDASGPYPADTLFYYASQGKFDAVVCMYHDQGLIPLKLLHFYDGVNITLGLPIIRTSVDHGTAYDIAGKGIANPASMLNAIRTAAQMAGAAH